MIDTESYIKEFNEQNVPFSLSKWVYDHPTAVKVGQIVGAIFGLVALVAVPFALPVLGAAVAWGVTSLGALSLLTTLGSWLFLKYVTCSPKIPGKREFQEAECPGGRLYYRGNIPILELSGKNAYESGKAHGYLLGAHIHELKGNLDLAIHSILCKPRAAELPDVLNALSDKIPGEYLAEMEGLAAGYKQWAEEAGVATSLQVDDILLMHLIADSKHFHAEQVESRFESLQAVACTALVHRDPENGVLVGRNMEWCPFGQGGAKSLVFVWKEKEIAALGVPGLIGAITGWNKDRLTLAMNVSPGDTTEVRGMPAMLFNRSILENAKTVSEAKVKVQQGSPLGPYHLTLADATGDAVSVALYQGKGEARDYVRPLTEEPLVVLNWKYPDCKEGSFNSSGREKLLKQYFEGAQASIAPEKLDWHKLIDHALRLVPLVNSWITMHSLLFRPEKNEVALSWDNGYAASVPRERLEMTAVF